MTLDPHEVRVYWLESAATQDDTAHFRAMLSTEEVARANSFVREAPRQEFVIARGALRVLLGRVLAVQPSAVPIRIGANGKPETTGCEFNVSHARGIIVIALSGAGPVGVDVEPWDESVECMDIARQAFTAADVERMQAADLVEQRKIFFELWTRREATAKYFSAGIGNPSALRGELPGHGVHVESLKLASAFTAAIARPLASTLVCCEKVSLKDLIHPSDELTRLVFRNGPPTKT